MYTIGEGPTLPPLVVHIARIRQVFLVCGRRRAYNLGIGLLDWFWMICWMPSANTGPTIADMASSMCEVDNIRTTAVFPLLAVFTLDLVANPCPKKPVLIFAQQVCKGWLISAFFIAWDMVNAKRADCSPLLPWPSKIPVKPLIPAVQNLGLQEHCPGSAIRLFGFTP